MDVMENDGEGVQGPPPWASRRSLDVRPVLAAGEEPYGAIMEAVEALGPAEVLVLDTPFDPQPLHGVLGAQGFARSTREEAPDHYVTEYWLPGPMSRAHPAGRAARDAAPAVAGTEVVLDVRGMQPPEPVALTLEALEGLPDGARLIQVNERVPVFLLPHLDELGFEYSIGEDDRGTIVTITRARG